MVNPSLVTLLASVTQLPRHGAPLLTLLKHNYVPLPRGARNLLDEQRRLADRVKRGRPDPRDLGDEAFLARELAGPLERADHVLVHVVDVHRDERIGRPGFGVLERHLLGILGELEGVPARVVVLQAVLFHVGLIALEKGDAVRLRGPPHGKVGAEDLSGGGS